LPKVASSVSRGRSGSFAIRRQRMGIPDIRTTPMSTRGVVQNRVTPKTRIPLLSELYRFPVLPGKGT
jgi:hypothetical protein